MNHLLNICNINGAEVEPVWVIIGGSPCQDLSVAGKRAGLAGASKSSHAICIGNGQTNQSVDDKAGALNCMHDQQSIAIPVYCGTDDYLAEASEEVSNTLKAVSYKSPPYCNIGYAVRRLTPLECERLQGYPDGWTDIPGASDSARYKALGNSIALPFWRWMLKRMSAYLPKGATLGSLFDGIGGFPLIWEEIHGKGSARWASEIEPFPIRVTEYHFGGLNE